MFTKEIIQLITFEVSFLCFGILAGLYLAEKYNIKLVEELKSLIHNMNNDGGQNEKEQ